MTAERSQAGGADPPLPAGFRIELDPDTRQLTEAILFGGSPARAMKLSAAGCRALGELRAGPVRSAAAGVLARRLTDAGLAHPRPPAAPAPAAADVTVLIPVRDRAGMLDQCLTALGRAYPVIVVDDGSADPDGVAAVVARHHAALVRRQASGGPGMARNDGLADIGSELVAFLDSDCAPPPGWIDRLAAHLADPLVGAVAPRVVGAPGGACPQTAAGRYEEACGSLDLGPREARVVPGSRVAYVPTAALLVRRAALEAAAGGRPVFDAALRYGEDVDLIWRMHDSGWRIRYEPAIRVAHRGPQSWADLLARRFRYGTSGAPLARRHPGRLAPLVLQPWPALTVAAILARRPVAAAAAAAAGWLTLRNTVRSAGLPAGGVAAATATAVRQTGLGIGRYATQFAAPALAVALTARGRRVRAAALSLLLAPAIDAYQRRKPGLDPVRFGLAHIADDIAYGTGVWAGCARERTLAPVTPLIAWRPLRVTSPGNLERNAPDGQHLV